MPESRRAVADQFAGREVFELDGVHLPAGREGAELQKGELLGRCVVGRHDGGHRGLGRPVGEQRGDGVPDAVDGPDHHHPGRVLRGGSRPQRWEQGLGEQEPVVDRPVGVQLKRITDEGAVLVEAELGVEFESADP